MQLFSELGIVRQSSSGLFVLTPLGIRSLEKLVKIVDKELKNVGCQKLQLPILTAGNLWKRTGEEYLNVLYCLCINNWKKKFIVGRWESTGSELLTVNDRYGRNYVLSPVRHFL